MKATAATLVLALTGCAGEADLFIELHRATTDSDVALDFCDADKPDDCDGIPDSATLRADRTVHEIAIYLDQEITPPLTVELQQTDPASCRGITLDPAAQSGPITITLATVPGGDLTIADCPTCDQDHPCR